MAEISFGIISNAVRFFTGFWEYYKKRPNIKITIGYATHQEVSKEPAAVMDVPKIITIKDDPPIAIITLTNIGYLPAELEELHIIAQGQDIQLYYTSNSVYGCLGAGSEVIKPPEEFNKYNSDDGILGTLGSCKRYRAKVRAGLFFYGISDIYVVDTTGNRWSVDKKELDLFMIEWNELRDILS